VIGGPTTTVGDTSVPTIKKIVFSYHLNKC